MAVSLPVLSVDLTSARVHGQGFGNLSNWGGSELPYVGST